MDKWRVADPVWMAARKASWRQLKPRFKRASSEWDIPVSEFEAYYLAGQGKIGTTNPLLRLWFDPEASVDQWRKTVASMGPDEIEAARGHILSMSSDDLRLWPEPEGFMDGLELELAEQLFPNAESSGASQLAGPAAPIANPTRFVRQWWYGMERWLIDAASPRVSALPQLAGLMWGALSEKVRDTLDPFWFVTAQCRHFVDPRAVPGTDTAQSSFAKAFAHEIETHTLPPEFERVRGLAWTREARTRMWQPLEEEEPWPFEGYPVRGVQGEGDAGALLLALVEVYRELGFCASGFEASGLRAISLRNHLQPWLLKQFGVSGNEALAGYSYRIETNAEYSDGSNLVHVDVVAPVGGEGKASDAPVLLSIPRPTRALSPQYGIAYRLNDRMAARVFEQRTSHALLQYEHKGGGMEPVSTRHQGPFILTKHSALKAGRRGVLDDAAHDFPAWSGKPLPPLKVR